MALLTWETQYTIKKWTDKKIFDQINNETEDLELPTLLGVSFSQDIQENPNNYEELLNGSVFVGFDNLTYKHKGLLYVIAYMNYSRYIGLSNIVDSSTGFVTKTRPESENISEGTLKRIQNDNRQLAMTAFETIKMYLDVNTDIYPLWNCTNSKKVWRPKFIGLKNTTL